MISGQELLFCLHKYTSLDMAVIECRLQIEQPRIYRRVSDSFLSIFRLRICLLRCHLVEHFNDFNFFEIIIKKEKICSQNTIPTAKLTFGIIQDEVERRRHMKWLNTLQFLWS